MNIFNIELPEATRNKSLGKIFKLQKGDINIMVNLDQNRSVKYHFQQLKILTNYGLYVLQTTLSVIISENNVPKLRSNHVLYIIFDIRTVQLYRVIKYDC